MRKILTFTLYITGIIAFWNLIGLPSEAGYKEDSMNKIYTQLTSEQLNEASASYSSTDIPTIAEFEEYISNVEDDPENLFDGDMVLTRGYITTLWREGVLTISLNNSYNIKEADALTDSMAQEIMESIKDTNNQRLTMAAICKYITSTYEYDAEAAAIEKSGNYGERVDFVKAYHGNKKILCTDYAALTYLLCNKMGIKCQLVFGKNHVYNTVKFNDTNRWIAYDLASGSKYAQVTTYDYIMNDLYHITDGSEAAASAKILNRGKTYRFASPLDIAREIIDFAIIGCIPEIIGVTAIVSVIVFLTVMTMANKKTSKKHKRTIKRKRLARA